MTALKKEPLPINSDVLVWARKRCGLNLVDVAKKIKVNPGQLAKWEAGEASPTPRQGRILAKMYDRPFLEFFSSSKPDVPETNLVPDFRFFAKGPSQVERRSLVGIQQWAEEQRLNALALIEEIGELPPILSDNLRFSIRDSVDTAAETIREAIDYPIEEQIRLPKGRRAQLPIILRNKIEGMGVLVLKKSCLTKLRARGICLFAEPLPVIVFGNETASAQAFTIIHEFGHILLGSSAISGVPRFGPDRLTGSKAIESWCNRFAASFLVPSSALKALESKPDQPLKQFDLSKLQSLADKFSISRHAMLIRLVNLSFVHPNFYWQTMRPVFLEEEANSQGFGRPLYYGKRYVNSQGLFYTGLVLEAWGAGRISGHNAAEYMGIKNLSHLKDIREDFRV